MIALIQRVSEASVAVDAKVISEISHGLLAFIGVTKMDSPENVDALAKKILTLRIFPDDQGKMNLNIKQVAGELLLVPQFTLAANTSKGLRPSFENAAVPEHASKLFARLSERCMNNNDISVQTGQFQADMKVSLINDGPLTFWVEK